MSTIHSTTRNESRLADDLLRSPPPAAQSALPALLASLDTMPGDPTDPLIATQAVAVRPTLARASNEDLITTPIQHRSLGIAPLQHAPWSTTGQRQVRASRSGPASDNVVLHADPAHDILMPSASERWWLCAPELDTRVRQSVGRAKRGPCFNPSASIAEQIAPRADGQRANVGSVRCWLAPLPWFAKRYANHFNLIALASASVDRPMTSEPWDLLNQMLVPSGQLLIEQLHQPGTMAWRILQTRLVNHGFHMQRIMLAEPQFQAAPSYWLIATPARKRSAKPSTRRQAA